MTLPDVQNGKSKITQKIDEVGISDWRLPVKILEKNGNFQNTIGTFKVVVSLDENQKGTHMSRIIRTVLDALGNSRYMDIFSLNDISVSLVNNLDADYSKINVKFPYFLEKISPVSKIRSEVVYDCEIEMEYIKNGDTNSKISCKGSVTTVCPCSLEISEKGAHNQRADIEVSIKTKHSDEKEKIVWIEDIINIIESSGSCGLYTVLKRPDEKFVTEKMFSNPKFVEDITREVYKGIKESIVNTQIIELEIKTTSYESIHYHNAVCVIKE